ncbi:hypothetical protein HNP84_005253 [Thermocatellispora tengchongensis]|uniref:Uncharacterized protein n=1 Tax=Thermocatellispora tengchongensis TaxID=1073253 RepID=A0A840P935_9ACTN|nr:hypothetical protein [Thermocatellispora tengchongensis]MBB5135509.1 hypothetical protein [Thermocatellispora tengchongensis]
MTETVPRPPRLLIAPVTITATKPLLPTHIKGFLWVDVLLRATRAIGGEAECLWNPRTPNLTGQTIQFWDYLDRELGDVDYEGLSADEIGKLYVECHASGRARPLKELRPLAERVEREGWTHPAGLRMSRDWARHLTLLGVRNPDLLTDRPQGLPIDEVVELLARRRLCLDHRRYGGPVYLDGTRWGMPLRTVMGADGHANYVLVALRDVISHAPGHDRVLLVHDEEAAHDFALIERVLRELGTPASRLALGRVPLGGTPRSSRHRSSRHGGWEGFTIERIAALCLDRFDETAYRLGMRLYFIAMLKRTAGEPLRLDLLRRALLRAERLVRAAGDAAPGGPGVLRRYATPAGWVSPYRLTDALFARRDNPARGDLLRSIYL